MNDLKVFSYEGATVRTVEKSNEPWFIAVDVCRVLDIGNPTDAVNRLDEDERTLVSIEGASNGLQVNAVNESGLYTLILSSRKPQAKAFKRWVTHEVLPSIRKTGFYNQTIDYKKLPCTNHAASILMRTFKQAGANTTRLTSMISTMYRGIGVPVPAIEAPQDKKLYTAEDIASKIGLYSVSGKPHAQLVGAIIREIGIPDRMITKMTFERNGHSGVSDQYAEDVISIVREFVCRYAAPEIQIGGRCFKRQ